MRPPTLVFYSHPARPAACQRVTQPQPCFPLRHRGSIGRKMDNLGLIGLNPAELQCLRLVIALLRHPDPVVAEVAREALQYLEGLAERADPSRATG